MVAAYRAGDNVGTIAKQFGFHRGTVATYLKRAGLIVRADPKDPDTSHKILDVYDKLGTYKGTARELGINRKTVRKIATRGEDK